MPTRHLKIDWRCTAPAIDRIRPEPRAVPNLANPIMGVMTSHSFNQPLTAREFDRLGEFLSRIKRAEALQLEGMDGLFCALIAGPEWVMPSQYLPLLWGGPLPDDIVMFNVPHVNAMMSLLMRHWNCILAELDAGAVHAPLLGHGALDGVSGRAWAQGFMRGVNFTQGGWNELFQGEPPGNIHRIARLAEDIDPNVLQDPLPQFAAEEFSPRAASAVAGAYQHFLDRRCADRLMVELASDVATRWLNSPDLPT
jgi:uncharacterized protein